MTDHINQPFRTCTTTGVAGRECFTAGQNCAQAVLEAGSHVGGACPVSAGAGFTQGIGGSGCLCGSVAGAILTISTAVEAEGLDPQATRERAEALSAEFHDRFKAEWGSTCCRVLKRGQEEGSDAWNTHCAELTEWSAATAAGLLADRHPARKRTPFDIVDIVRRVALDTLAYLSIGAFKAVAFGWGSAWVLVVAAVMGIVIGTVLEVASPLSRRIARLIRAAGAVVAALLAVLAVALPERLLAGLEGLLAPGPMAIAARLLVAVPLVVWAGLTAWGYKRFK